jgi:hypothetical protein
MLIDENDLAHSDVDDLQLVQEMGIRPVHRDSFTWSPHGIAGITAQRGFRRQGTYVDLVARVTPYSSEELAIAHVEHADETIVHDPTKRVEILRAHNLGNIQIDGLQTVFAHEETMKVGDKTYTVLIIFSHVGQVLFSIQISSQNDYWKWEDAASLAIIQADKIRRNSNMLGQIF